MGLAAGGSEGTSNGTTDVTVVAAPGASEQRIVRTVAVHNTDTVAATVTIKKAKGGSEYIIAKDTLAVGETLFFGGTGESIILDATDETVEIVLAGAVTTNQLDYTAAYATQS